jgi:hypothetical protein
MLIKRITTGLLGVAIIGIFIVNCEKMDGPDPEVCIHWYNQLSLWTPAAQPLRPYNTLDSLEKVVITDSTLTTMAIVPNPIVDTTKIDTIKIDTTVVDLSSIGKIVFVSNSNLP